MLLPSDSRSQEIFSSITLTDILPRMFACGLTSIKYDMELPDRSASMGMTHLSSEKSISIRSGWPDANSSVSGDSSSASVIPAETGRA